jgi:hypothetical protein
VDTQWAIVEGSYAANTGWVETTQRTRNGVAVGSETISHSYFLLGLTDTKALLVEMSPSLQDTEEIDPTVTGALVPFSSSVSRNILPGVIEDLKPYEIELLPYMMTTDDYRSEGYLGLVVGALALVGFGVLAYIGLDRLQFPHKHPIHKALAHFGEPGLVADEIDRELAGARINTSGKLHLTDRWAVLRSGGFKFTRYQDMVWAYPKVTTTRMYGVVPINRSTELIWWDRHGQNFALPVKQKDLEPLMAVFAERAPGIMLGYKKEIEQLWSQNRAQFIAAVDQRRQTTQ